MARIIEGQLVDAGGRYAIVAGRFNEFITSRLVSGAEDALARHGVDTDTRLDVIWVPGAFEIPLVCQKIAASGEYAAVMALGAVIRGSTPHFDFVASEVSKGVANASMKTGVPIVFGVLTVENRRQALVRSVIDGDVDGDNKGGEAAVTALEMISVLEAVRAG